MRSAIDKENDNQPALSFSAAQKPFDLSAVEALLNDSLSKPPQSPVNKTMSRMDLARMAMLESPAPFAVRF